MSATEQSSGRAGSSFFEINYQFDHKNPFSSSRALPVDVSKWGVDPAGAGPKPRKILETGANPKLAPVRTSGADLQSAPELISNVKEAENRS